MGLKEDLLRGIYAYGFEKPSAIQQRAIVPLAKGHDSDCAGAVRHGQNGHLHHRHLATDRPLDSRVSGMFRIKWFLDMCARACVILVLRAFLGTCFGSHS
jgi:hypothetical protein